VLDLSALSGFSTFLSLTDRSLYPLLSGQIDPGTLQRQ